jgi:hypothetical protein
MTAEDMRIVLRMVGEVDDVIVAHPGQPADYVHADGTIWTWQERWRLAGGHLENGRSVGATLLRLYSLVTRSTRSG